MFEELDSQTTQEVIDLPYPVVNALAWWLVSELIRRHPKELRVIETNPGGGMYDCLTLVSRDRGLTLMQLNRTGRIKIRYTDRSNYNQEFYAEWLALLRLGRQRKLFIKSIEEALNLPTRSNALPTHQHSVGIRLIANLAGRIAFSNKTWDVRNAMVDTSGVGGGPNEKWMASFPQLDLARLETDFFGSPYYRYWCLLDFNKKPMLCIDVDKGLAWQSPTGRHDLMDLYAGNRSIDYLVQQVAPSLE